MTRLVEGNVDRLRCRNCRATTSIAGFVGENDVVTMGLVSFVSLATQEVIIAEAEGSEFARSADECVSSVLRRVSIALGRSDLCFVPLLRAEHRRSTGPLRFRGFFPVEYDPPQLFFRCPHCAGEATIEREETFAEFQRGGGKLTIVGDMKLKS